MASVLQLDSTPSLYAIDEFDYLFVDLPEYGNVTAVDSFVLGPENPRQVLDEWAVIYDSGQFVIMPANEAADFQPVFSFDDISNNKIVVLKTLETFEALLLAYPEREKELLHILCQFQSPFATESEYYHDFFDLLTDLGISCHQEIEEIKNYIKELEGKINSLVISDALVSNMANPVTDFGSSRSETYRHERLSSNNTERSQINRELRILEQELALKEDVQILLVGLNNEFVLDTYQTGDSYTDTATLALVASVNEEMGETQNAHEFYEEAVIQTPDDNPMAALYLELQSIRTLPDNNKEDSRLRIAALWEYFDKAKQEPIPPYEEALVDFNITPMDWQNAVLQQQNYLIAQTLGLLTETYIKLGIDPDDDVYALMVEHLLTRMVKVKQTTNTLEEANVLAASLGRLEELRIEEAVKYSQMGDLDAVYEYAPQMQTDVLFAQRMYAALEKEDHPILASLMQVAYFNVYQQSGLPVDALENWYDNIYADYKNNPYVAEFVLKLKDSAPHLWGSDGSLLPRSQMTLSPDALAAIEAEGSLHVFAGTLGESLAIGTVTWATGCAAGAKGGAVVGTVIGGPPGGAVGGVVGGLGGAAVGYVGGEEILQAIHGDEIEKMETQVGIAGLALARVQPEEAETLYAMNHFLYGSGIALSMMGYKPGAQLFSSGARATGMIGRGAWSLGKKETYVALANSARFGLAEVGHELQFSKNLLRAGYQGGRGFLFGPAPESGLPTATRTAEEMLPKTLSRMSAGQKAFVGGEAGARELAQGLQSLSDDAAAKLATYKQLASEAAQLEAEGAPRELINEAIQRASQAYKAYQGAASQASQVLHPPTGAPMPMGSRGILDRMLWQPLNYGLDKGLGLEAADALWRSRLDAATMAVRTAVPELGEEQAIHVFRKELLNHQLRLNAGWELGLARQPSVLAQGIKGFSSRVGPYVKPLWSDQLFTPQFARAHRLGMVAAGLDLFYDADMDDVTGGGWTLHDGDIDAPWGFAGLVMGTGYYSTRLGINSIYGADLAGGFKALTFASFLGMSGMALEDVDFQRLTGSQIEYIVILPTTLMLYSGLHSAGASRLMQGLNYTPGLRRLPSLSAPMWGRMYGAAVQGLDDVGVSFVKNNAPSLISPYSPLTRPDMIGAGRALSLGYTIPYIAGVTYMFKGKGLLDCHTYMVGQRAAKFSAVGVFLNPLMIALGGKTPMAQGVTRALGYGFDMVPALVMSPYYQSGVYKDSLFRSLESYDPTLMSSGDEDRPMDIFLSRPGLLGSSWLGQNFSTINRTYDIGGVLNDAANPYSTVDWKDPGSYTVGWRWEPDSMAKWADVMDQIAMGDPIAKREGLSSAYTQFATDYENELVAVGSWQGDEQTIRGMLCGAILIKSMAAMYEDGIQEYKPYYDFIQNSPYKSIFWDKVWQPKVTAQDSLYWRNAHENALSFEEAYQGLREQITQAQEKPIEEIAAIFQQVEEFVGTHEQVLVPVYRAAP